jgi:hypothetical protein
VGEYTVLALFLLLLLQACSDNNNNSPGSQRSQPVNPAVEGPITGGGGPDCCRIRFGGLEIDLRERGYVPGTPFYAGGFFDLAEVGYQEKEYFISGIATSYVNSEELQSDGKWSVMEGEGAEYNSRIVVQRPIDADDFNGTVVVEWFNVSGGLDAAPDWLQTHTELHREGYVWVGVSAQRVGIDGGGPFGLPLKTVDSERYGDLDHPGDSFAYDIFSQAAQAVRRPVGLDPMEGLKVERMIAVGQSQASFHLTSYYNAINPTLDIFDAYLVHSRARNSAPLSQQPQVCLTWCTCGKINSSLQSCCRPRLTCSVVWITIGRGRWIRRLSGYGKWPVLPTRMPTPPSRRPMTRGMTRKWRT